MPSLQEGQAGPAMAPRRLRTVLLVLAAFSMLLVMLWALQRRLIYYPAGPPPPAAEVLPGARDVTLSTSDGLELGAWYLPGADRRVAVVVLPGNAGNRAARAPLARRLADGGPSVLLVDYRGYGGNPGSPHEAGLLADARAAVAWVTDRPDVEQVVYLGESIGAAVAVAVAGDRPPAAMVLRSPFTSLPDVARVHYGLLPDWVLRDRYPVESRIGAVDAPVLVVAGAGDEIVPVGLSRRVHEAAREPKRLVVVPGAGHNDPLLASSARLVDPLLEFLREHTELR